MIKRGLFALLASAVSGKPGAPKNDGSFLIENEKYQTGTGGYALPTLLTQTLVDGFVFDLNAMDGRVRDKKAKKAASVEWSEEGKFSFKI
jgi:hypothetical protein